MKTDKQNKRKGITKERLAFCDVNAYITNTTEEQLPNKLIRLFYSLRWQIEIIFKVWKSIFKIDKVKKMKVERFECFHYANLITIVISTNLFKYFKQYVYHKRKTEISELKTFKVIKAMLFDIQKALDKDISELNNIFDKTCIIIDKFCIKEQKKNKLKPLIILQKLTLA